jgi:hypothetical protein
MLEEAERAEERRDRAIYSTHPVTQRICNGKLALAWNAWAGFMACQLNLEMERRHTETLMRRVLNRLKNGLESAAFATWCEATMSLAQLQARARMQAPLQRVIVRGVGELAVVGHGNAQGGRAK